MAAITTHVPLISEDAVRNTLKKRAQRRPLVIGKLLALTMAKKLSPSKRLRTKIEDATDTRLARLLDEVQLREIYYLILTERMDEVRTALEVCNKQWSSGEATRPMLVHCTHGKDRTGVLVALLLSMCGVDEDDILEDYAISHEWGCSPEGEFAMWQGLPGRIRNHVQPQTIKDWCMAPEAELACAFDSLKQRYGSVAAYLDTIGVDAAFRSSIAEMLTMEA